VKHKVLQEMEEILPAHGIFASNTSAIPIGRIAEKAKRSVYLFGHFFFTLLPFNYLFNNPILLFI
jgi:3-hydroxyacyl-CoA dehydrogenase